MASADRGERRPEQVGQHGAPGARVLWVPLHTPERRGRVLEGLDGAVVGAADHDESLARTVDGLVMRAADVEFDRAEDAGEYAPWIEDHAVVDHSGEVLAGDRAADMTGTGKVLHEVASERDVDQLHPAADVDQRSPGLDGAADERHLRAVGCGKGLAAVRIVQPAAVERRIDVLPTGDHDGVGVPALELLGARLLGRDAVDDEQDGAIGGYADIVPPGERRNVS
nr:hypothetical protein [Rathayibacter rathayi]